MFPACRRCCVAPRLWFIVRIPAVIAWEIVVVVALGRVEGPLLARVAGLCRGFSTVVAFTRAGVAAVEARRRRPLGQREQQESSEHIEHTLGEPGAVGCGALITWVWHTSKNSTKATSKVSQILEVVKNNRWGGVFCIKMME